MSDQDISSRIIVFNDVVHSAEGLLSIARDSDLQRTMITRLSELSGTVIEWKRSAVADRNEGHANLFLGMECVAKALRSELEMWLMLKKEEPERAWEFLIGAQTATCHAMRADRGFSQLDHHARRLDTIERVVFPPRVFLSAGLIVPKAICTICGADYEECSHLVGMPYWGEFCFRRLTDVVANHVAIVQDPANKLCRVTHFSDEGGRRNRMTWRLEIAEKGDSETQQMHGSGIVLSEKDLVC